MMAFTPTHRIVEGDWRGHTVEIARIRKSGRVLVRFPAIGRLMLSVSPSHLVALGGGDEQEGGLMEPFEPTHRILRGPLAGRLVEVIEVVDGSAHLRLILFPANRLIVKAVFPTSILLPIEGDHIAQKGTAAALEEDGAAAGDLDLASKAAQREAVKHDTVAASAGDCCIVRPEQVDALGQVKVSPIGFLMGYRFQHEASARFHFSLSRWFSRETIMRVAGVAVKVASAVYVSLPSKLASMRLTTLGMGAFFVALRRDLFVKAEPFAGALQ
jgi:hypothetical protein